jgi:hypothetical protein
MATPCIPICIYPCAMMETYNLKWAKSGCSATVCRPRDQQSSSSISSNFELVQILMRVKPGFHMVVTVVKIGTSGHEIHRMHRILQRHVCFFSLIITISYCHEYLDIMFVLKSITGAIFISKDVLPKFCYSIPIY